MKILVTGGAGFIGSYLVDALVENGHEVRIFDGLEQQVHGMERAAPSYLNKEAEFINGDMRDRSVLSKAIKDVEIIFHQASVVGVGQSMYEIYRYIDINTLGTANLLDILANEKHDVQKLIVASSMSIYGEGAYQCCNCGVVYPKLRSRQQLMQRRWEMRCPICEIEIKPVPTTEDKPLYATSIYAISKKDQEEMCLCVGRAYGIPTIALRYFNVYGPRQALNNPYTGVAAIFSSRILNGNPPIIFEDGLQSRDFIHVSDIVQANMLAMGDKKVDFGIFNVGTGKPITILNIAKILQSKLDASEEPQITHRFREGDIRHCYADISRIKEHLDFEPQVDFAKGIEDLTNWIGGRLSADYFDKAYGELEVKGLTL